MKKIIVRGIAMAAIAVAAITSIIGFSGCDSLSSLDTFTMQLPITMEFSWRNRQAPDTTTDFVNLLDYSVYRDNMEDIQSAKLYQVGYWMDTLVGDPSIENAEFAFVEFYLRFEGEQQQHLLGRYENVVVKEYYKRPHIITVPEEVALLISEAVKTKPRFDVIQRYSLPKNGSGFFPRIEARVDLAIRLEVKL
ncbi:MAG: hypothetical protein K1X90_08495 [Candidatus Kapabacteria bacterium]|nr:hypothetical protein [Candidatus Kapabacteria bacterium]